MFSQHVTLIKLVIFKFYFLAYKCSILAFFVKQVTVDRYSAGLSANSHLNLFLMEFLCMFSDLLKQLYPHVNKQEHLRLKQCSNKVVNLGDIRPKFRDNRKDIPVENDHRKYADRRVNEYGDYVDIRDIPYSAYRPKRFTHFNSMSDILDGSMMTNEDDDDLSTTTSGSYTVDDIDDSSLHPECVV